MSVEVDILLEEVKGIGLRSQAIEESWMSTLASAKRCNYFTQRNDGKDLIHTGTIKRLYDDPSLDLCYELEETTVPVQLSNVYEVSGENWDSSQDKSLFIINGELSSGHYINLPGHFAMGGRGISNPNVDIRPIILTGRLFDILKHVGYGDVIFRLDGTLVITYLGMDFRGKDDLSGSRKLRPVGEYEEYSELANLTDKEEITSAILKIMKQREPTLQVVDVGTMQPMGVRSKSRIADQPARSDPDNQLNVAGMF